MVGHVLFGLMIGIEIKPYEAQDLGAATRLTILKLPAAEENASKRPGSERGDVTNFAVCACCRPVDQRPELDATSTNLNRPAGRRIGREVVVAMSTLNLGFAGRRRA